jgi:hypothetical protein
MRIKESNFHLKKFYTLFLLFTASSFCSAEESVELNTLENNIVATLNAPSEVCIGDTFNATVTHGGTPPFEYTWSPASPNSFSVSIFAGLPGIQTLSVIVTDANGCQSPLTEWTYEVIPVIVAPLISCCSVDVTELCFCWNLVQKATGYDITVDGITVALDQFTSEYCLSGLQAEQEVNITITANSDNVCPDVSSSHICITSASTIDNDGDGVSEDEDCDDMDPNNFPGNIEFCDGQDNNCDGAIDEGLSTFQYYIDTDGDGFGDPNNSLTDCDIPDGYTLDNTDCDDSDPNINPNAIDEDSNGIDENCDGIDGTVSVSDLWDIELSIWPNPANRTLFIATNNDEEYTLHIVNIDGRTIDRYDTVPEIDVSDYTQGTYTLIFTDKDLGKSHIERMVILRR